jgi:hypothetical protein
MRWPVGVVKQTHEGATTFRTFNQQRAERAGLGSERHVVTVTEATVTARRAVLRGTSEAAQAGDVRFDLPVRGGLVTPIHKNVE